MESTDIKRLQEIKDKYFKLGWMPREDILWLLETLGYLCKKD